MGLVVGGDPRGRDVVVSQRLGRGGRRPTSTCLSPASTESERHYLNVSRALHRRLRVAADRRRPGRHSLSRRIVDEVLGIASFTNGVILGVFLLGTFTIVVGRRGAFAGMAIGALVMLAVRVLTPINWQWYVLIGSLATLAAGVAASRVLDDRARESGALISPPSRGS